MKRDAVAAIDLLDRTGYDTGGGDCKVTSDLLEGGCW